MALTNCPECKSEVPSEAAACPRCGYPIKSNAAPIQANSSTGGQPKPKTSNIGCAGLCVLAGVAFILIAIIGAFTGSIDTEQEHIMSHKEETMAGLNQDESATSSEFEEFIVAGIGCIIGGAWLQYKKK